MLFQNAVEGYRRENEISVNGPGEAKPVQGFKELEVPGKL